VTEETCTYCGDPLDENAIRRGDMSYCCEACAFEASRSADCGGRTDSPFPSTTTEAIQQQIRDS